MRWASHAPHLMLSHARPQRFSRSFGYARLSLLHFVQVLAHGSHLLQMLDDGHVGIHEAINAVAHAGLLVAI